MHSGYILTTVWLYFCCILTAFWLHSGYNLTTFRLHSDYILTTFWLYCDYILATSWLHSGYILATFWLHSGYILAICWLYSAYILAIFWLHAGLFILRWSCFHGIFPKHTTARDLRSNRTTRPITTDPKSSPRSNWNTFCLSHMWRCIPYAKYLHLQEFVVYLQKMLQLSTIHSNCYLLKSSMGGGGDA